MMYRLCIVSNKRANWPILSYSIYNGSNQLEYKYITSARGRSVVSAVSVADHESGKATAQRVPLSIKESILFDDDKVRVVESVVGRNMNCVIFVLKSEDIVCTFNDEKIRPEDVMDRSFAETA